MPNYAEAFLSELDRLVGREQDEIAEFRSTRAGLPTVYSFFYRDFPQAGLLTSVTLGISLGLHPTDGDGHPELVVTMRSSDRTWGEAAAWIGEQVRDQIALGVGSLLNINAPIIEGFGQSAFIIGEPVSWASSPIHLTSVQGNRTLRLLAAVPIFESERQWVKRHGAHAFWCQNELDLLDPHRPARF